MFFITLSSKNTSPGVCLCQKQFTPLYRSQFRYFVLKPEWNQIQIFPSSVHSIVNTKSLVFAGQRKLLPIEISMEQLQEIHKQPPDLHLKSSFPLLISSCSPADLFTFTGPWWILARCMRPYHGKDELALQPAEPHSRVSPSNDRNPKSDDYMLEVPDLRALSPKSPEGC